MTNPIEKSLPFSQKLGDNERYRLKNGQLSVEKKSERSSNALIRFFTRDEYSQTAILKVMSNLYKEAEQQQLADKKCHLTMTFLENYQALTYRAIEQNAKYQNTNFIMRFFKAKSQIDLTSSNSDLENIASKLEHKLKKDLLNDTIKKINNANMERVKKKAKSVEMQIKTLKNEIELIEWIIKTDEPPENEVLFYYNNVKGTPNAISIDKAEKLAKAAYKTLLSTKQSELLSLETRFNSLK